MNIRTQLCIHYTDANCISSIVHTLIKYIPKNKYCSIVIVCIGTDRCIGDAIGPFIGSILNQNKINFFSIYGTLEHPIHALNLQSTITNIQNKYSNPFIIALDASLGDLSNIGNIKIIDGPLHPGTALFKKLSPIGDIHITATVNLLSHNRLESLQNTRLYLIISISHVIAQALIVLECYLYDLYAI